MDKNKAINEMWKDVTGYEGIYQVSNTGRIKKLYREWVGSTGGKRFTNEKILPPHFSKFGYNHHIFIKEGKPKDLRVCRLVAIAFVPNPDNKPFVNHIDGNKANDSASNLEWNTRSENDRHAFANGLRSGMKGSKNGMAKIDEKIVLEIRKLYSSGSNTRVLADRFKLSIDHIGNIVKRRIWKHL